MTNSFLRQPGIDLPIIQAPMAGVQGSALAIAVSNAGGLGSLPCAMLSLDAIKKELGIINAATTGPYNVNFFCHKPIPFDAEKERQWRLLLTPYYDEFGLKIDDIPQGAARRPFSAEVAELLEEFRPAVVSFHFGLPAPDLLQRVKRLGAIILSSATTLEEARWLQANGADAVIAQGVEAGGHRGSFISDGVSAQSPTLVLLEQIVSNISLPVIAAGGVSNSADVQRMLAAGASAVQIGTAYLLCPEATTSAVHRSALIHPGPRTTALTNLFTGRPARGMVNRVIRELGPVNTLAPAFPMAATAITPLRQRAESLGSGDFSPLWCGDNPDILKSVPAADLTRELAGRSAGEAK